MTSVFVKPETAQGLPLPPEFIVPQDVQEKQDCERNTTKRWCERDHEHCPAHSVTYLGDDSYANQPLSRCHDAMADDALLVNWFKLVITDKQTGEILYHQ